MLSCLFPKEGAAKVLMLDSSIFSRPSEVRDPFEKVSLLKI